MGLRYFGVGVENQTKSLESSWIWVETQLLLLKCVMLDYSIYLSRVLFPDGHRANN